MYGCDHCFHPRDCDAACEEDKPKKPVEPNYKLPVGECDSFRKIKGWRE